MQACSTLQSGSWLSIWFVWYSTCTASHRMRLGDLCLDNQKKTVNRPQFFELPRNSTASRESQVTLIHTYSSCELTGDLTDVELNATGRKAEGNFLKGCGRLRV